MSTWKKSGTREWRAAGLLALLTAAAFLPALSGDFVAFDDPTYVIYPARDGRLAWSLANILHWFRTPVVGHYLPLTMLSYMLDHALWGLAPAGYHATNVLLHLGSGLLFLRLLRHLGFRRGVALFTASLFLVHPMRAESVAWVSERKDVLCLFLSLAAVVVYARRYRRVRGVDWAALALYAAAMLAKPMAVSLPLVLGVYALCREVRGRSPVAAMRTVPVARWLGLAPFVAVAAISVPVTIWTQRQFGAVAAEGSLGWGALVAWSNVFRYALKLLVPVDLSPLYPLQTSASTLLARALAGTGICAGAGCWLWRRHRRLLLDAVLPLAACYLLVLAPVSGLLPMGMIDFADRYSAFCHLPLLVLAGVGLQRLPTLRQRPRAAAALGIAVLAALTALTRVETARWRSTETLWQSVLGTAHSDAEVHPAVFAHYAKYRLTAAADPAGAVAIAERGIRAGHTRFDLFLTHARALRAMGRPDEAARFYRRMAAETVPARERLLFLEEGARTLLEAGDRELAAEFAQRRAALQSDETGRRLLERTGGERR